MSKMYYRVVDRDGDTCSEWNNLASAESHANHLGANGGEFTVEKIPALCPIVSFDDALNALRREYFGHCRDTAQELAQACRDGEIEDVEALRTRMHEECDGDGWIIYTQKAQIVLLVSDNDSAGPDSLGADGFDWSQGVPWSQLAYFAYEADLYEHLESEGIDVNDDSDWRATEDEDDAE